MLTRREFVSYTLSATALGGTVFTATRSIAQADLGGGTVTTVSDGALVLPEEFVIGDLPQDEAAQIVAAFAQDGQIRSPCNLALWQDGENTVLFDAGSGQGFMPSAGALVENLDAIGLTPDDVTHVLFTHAHPDHLWGALDDFDELLFANAVHIMGAEEHAHWSDPDLIDQTPPERQSFVVGAQRRLEIIGDRMELIAAGDAPLNGIEAIALPGHTKGHMGYRIKDGEQSALIVGDAIGNGHLALARPEWNNPADELPEIGRETRLNVLEMLAESGEPMVGFHLPDGGMGRIAAAQTGFEFRPI